MAEILNKDLYAVLCDKFHGDVEVVNPGETGRVVHIRKGEKYYAHTESTPEEGTAQEFKVNCPVCGDTRHRLYINYLVGADIRHQGNQLKTWHLMHCQNEQCRLGDLYLEIRAGIKNPPKIAMEKIVRDKTRVEIQLPAPNWPINSTKAHPAPVAYMQSRGFDLDELSNVYGVRTCEYVPGMEHLGQMTLFPYYDGSRLTFWQARMSYDPPKSSKMPKYVFQEGTQKSTIIYNKYNAMRESMVVITEGVLDAIRVGLPGVAIYGKHPSVFQTRMISRVFRRKLGVLMLDADADDKATKWFEKYKGDALFEKGLYICRLSEEDGDPANLTREAVWDRIIKAIEGGT